MLLMLLLVLLKCNAEEEDSGFLYRIFFIYYYQLTLITLHGISSLHTVASRRVVLLMARTSRFEWLRAL